MPNQRLSHEEVERLIEEELHEIETANQQDGKLSQPVVRRKGWWRRMIDIISKKR